LNDRFSYSQILSDSTNRKLKTNILFIDQAYQAQGPSAIQQGGMQLAVLLPFLLGAIILLTLVFSEF